MAAVMYFCRGEGSPAAVRVTSGKMLPEKLPVQNQLLQAQNSWYQARPKSVAVNSAVQGSAVPPRTTSVLPPALLWLGKQASNGLGVFKGSCSFHTCYLPSVGMEKQWAVTPVQTGAASTPEI